MGVSSNVSLVFKKTSSMTSHRDFPCRTQTPPTHRHQTLSQSCSWAHIRRNTKSSFSNGHSFNVEESFSCCISSCQSHPTLNARRGFDPRGFASFSRTNIGFFAFSSRKRGTKSFVICWKQLKKRDYRAASCGKAYLFHVMS